MKFFFSWSIVILFLTSCQSQDESVDVAQTNTPTPMALEEPPFEIDIDESDLLVLPEDIGGEQVPHPYGSTAAPYGYYAYTPAGYKADGADYPLIIFLHGWNPNLGNEPLENVLNSGPSRLIRTGKWNPRFPFIVVSPQLKGIYWAPNTIHSFVEHLIDTYPININRIYLTGLSLGGGGCWYYVGEVNDHYAAAIVPISASGAEYLIDNLRQIPIWAFHGARDRTVAAYENFGSVPLVNAINLTNPGTKARVTVYPNLAHNAWTTTYDGSGKFHNQLHDKYEVDLYDWMLSYKKE